MGDRVHSEELAQEEEEEKSESPCRNQAVQAITLNKLLFSGSKQASSTKIIVPKEEIKFAGRSATA